MMMKKNPLLILLLSLILFFGACETDFDIDAEWKEITIVYGLLDQLDSSHYFRINKAFLGGNALEVVKIEDSSSYKNDLEVVLEGWNAGSLMQSIACDTTTISDKDTGLWYNPYMVVYKGDGILNTNYEYRLFIKNKVSGKEITAETNIVQDFSIIRPNAGGKATFNKGYTSKFSWKYAVDGQRYEPQIRFNYYEVPVGTTDTIPKYLLWPQGTQFADNLTGSGEFEIFVSGDAFYENLERKLDPNFVGHRLAGLVDYVISVAGVEYDTYMKVNGPSFSLVQDRPEYTNIENGFGLFSSRYQETRTLQLNPLSEQEIINMEDLSFVKSPYVGK
jgi:hypothetical protein